MESLTTNAIAARAGVSIGTVYQYFGNKQAILNGLIQKRVTILSTQVAERLQGPAPARLGSRVGALMSAALNAYGGKQKAHRLLLIQALTKGDAMRLNPLLQKLTVLFASGEVDIPGHPNLSSADSFVMVHAFLGVMRAVVTFTDRPPTDDIEDSLTRLLVNFVGPKTRPEES